MKHIKLYEEFSLDEKWEGDVELNPEEEGKFDDWSLEDLRKEQKRLRSMGSHTPAQSTMLKQVNFAIRAKTGWGKA